MRIVLLLLLALGLSLGLAACDGDDDETETRQFQTGDTDADAGTVTILTQVGDSDVETDVDADASGNDGPPDVDADATVTDSGLQIIDVVVGDGDEATPGSTVTVHYTGWLTNGEKFDSSYDRGQPISFALQGLIEGWQEGIPGMKVGGTRRLIIPPELGYGEAGSPPAIPPNAELIFDIELLAVE